MAADSGVAEHETFMEALKAACSCGQLNVGISAAFELLLRKAETIEYARQEKMKDQTGQKGSQKHLPAGATPTVEEKKAVAGTPVPGCLWFARSCWSTRRMTSRGTQSS